MNNKKYTINGKRFRCQIDNQGNISTPREYDRSKNILEEGDKVLHITGKSSYSFNIHTVQRLKVDGTNVFALCIALSNGQYTSPCFSDLLLVPANFCDLHKRLLSVRL